MTKNEIIEKHYKLMLELPTNDKTSRVNFLSAVIDDAIEWDRSDLPPDVREEEVKHEDLDLKPVENMDLEDQLDVALKTNNKGGQNE